ncbi:hypothetical protein Pcinc_011321 [Petrolisthes cinctipes]|uniref:Dual specificity protein phosphatase n=1 Tax=Petrolisthes cinctipes TaxID=88211 RepID=A0AAE1G747_PETCI|nr:hypothetical protein Pcinc_011321 [Petrolisthes cinctipes]
MAYLQCPTTPEHLQNAIQDTEPESSTPMGFSRFTLSMNQCYPGLYVGNCGAARNKANLKKTGITHILNAAQGKRYAMVDTDAEYYQSVGITFLGFQLLDSPTANITRYLEEGAHFIDEALHTGGKVLVCCFMGMSRSATMACGFLMLRRNISAVEAITTLRRARAIEPNTGFLSQLADLDNKLRTDWGTNQ